MCAPAPSLSHTRVCVHILIEDKGNTIRITILLLFTLGLFHRTKCGAHISLEACLFYYRYETYINMFVNIFLFYSVSLSVLLSLSLFLLFSMSCREWGNAPNQKYLVIFITPLTLWCYFGTTLFYFFSTFPLTT